MDREQRYRIRKNHLSKRRKSIPPTASVPAAASNGNIQVSSRKGVIHLMMNLKLSHRILWILFFIFLLALLLLTTSLDDRLRSMAIDFLFGILQILLFKEHPSKS
jgi:hypothetical protein